MLVTIDSGDTTAPGGAALNAPDFDAGSETGGESDIDNVTSDIVPVLNVVCPEAGSVISTASPCWCHICQGVRFIWLRPRLAQRIWLPPQPDLTGGPPQAQRSEHRQA